MNMCTACLAAGMSHHRERAHDLVTLSLLQRQRFSGVDRLYWDVPCHLVPPGKTGMQAFAVICAAIRSC
jgi:hypothetical protein